MATAEELLLKVKTDAKSAEKDMGNFATKAEKSAKRAQTAFSNAGRKMTTSLTLPIVAGAGIAVKAFMEQEDATRKLQSAFDSTGASAWTNMEALQANADSLQQLTTHGDEAIEGMQSVLLTFTQIQGTNFDAATMSVLNMSDALGMDLQSAATMVGKALNDPVAGIAAMSRAGITFSEEQKETIKALVEIGDTAGAQAVMLGELETQFGGTAEAMSETSSGQMKQAMNTMGDSMETVGGIIIPILTQIADWIKKVAEKFDALSPEMQKTIVKVLAVVAAIGPLLMIGGKLIGVISSVGKAMTVLAAHPILLFLAALAAAVYLIWTNWDTIVEFFKTVGAKFFDWFIEKWQAVKDFMGALWDGVVDGFKGVVNSILSVVEGSINKAIDLINGAIKAYNKVPLAPDIPTLQHVSVPRLAEGGMTLNSGPVRVGERGTEIINLPKGSTVQPDTGGGVSGANVTIERMDGGDPVAMAEAIGWEFTKRRLA